MALEYEVVEESGGKGWLGVRDELGRGCAVVGANDHWPLEDLGAMKALMDSAGSAPGFARVDLRVPEAEFAAMRVSLAAFEGRDTVGGRALGFDDAQDFVRRVAKALARHRDAAADVRYEGLESVDGYGFVDIRDEDGGSTVLGSDGRLTVGMAEEAAAVLERTLPRNDLFIDASPEQMAYAAEVVGEASRLGLDAGRLDPGSAEDLTRDLRSAHDTASVMADLAEELRAEGSSPSP